MGSEKNIRKLVKLLMNPTRLALLLILASVNMPFTLNKLEKILKIPRQTIHSHLEEMVEAGIILKKWVITDRPRVVYTINLSRTEEILSALKYIKENVVTLEEILANKSRNSI